MKIKSSILLVCSFLTIWTGKSSLAADLQGKFALSAKGGMCHSMANGFSYEAKMKNNYGFGVSLEYFLLRPLSGGLSLVHNSFQAGWEHRGYYPYSDHYYSSDWNWTNISIFARFVLGPQNRVSPYLRGGVGLCIPRIKDWWFDPPDTVRTHTSYEKGVFGYHLGFGIHYLLTKKLLVYLDVPFNIIHTDEMKQSHRISEKSHYFNIFVGFSFLFGTGKEVKKPSSDRRQEKFMEPQWKPAKRM